MAARLPVFVSALALSLTDCATQKTLEATGGSRSDGVIDLSYEYTKFEDPRINLEQGRKVAEQRCAAWGYSAAEPFGGQTRACNQAAMFGGCARWLVTLKYQCTGAPVETAGVPPLSAPPVSIARAVDPASKQAPPPTGPGEGMTRAPHVRLGVHCVKMTPELAETAHLPVDTSGVQVVTVEAGSVAEANGVRVGDVLLKYGDRSLHETSDLTAAIAATAQGASVQITVRRRTGEQVVDVQF